MHDLADLWLVQGHCYDAVRMYYALLYSRLLVICGRAYNVESAFGADAYAMLSEMGLKPYGKALRNSKLWRQIVLKGRRYSGLTREKVAEFYDFLGESVDVMDVLFGIDVLQRQIEEIMGYERIE